jgi:REP element-mobilizing transposase RayT
LAALFAVEVCAYAIMANHYHTVLRTRPDIVAGWSDREVATRWLRLFPTHDTLTGTELPPTEEQISALAACLERIAELRKRLSNLSWFMGRLNEFIARAANKEDEVKGRFWESRFKCQALLDEAAIAACMVYVDLNPIRAGSAATPEESDFTSIQERIRAWHKEKMDSGTSSSPQKLETTAECIPDNSNTSTCWLCPIQSDARRRGILQMTTAEYIDLIDKSGRILRSDKQGAMDADLEPILLRLGANPDVWLDTVSRFGSKFRLAAGLLSNLRSYANRLGKRWLSGISAARLSFAPAQSPSA